MEVRRDSKGRPVGLAWPEAPEFTEEQIAKSSRYNNFNGNEWRGGRGRSKMCAKGLHDMNVHGREIPTGGRYCNACKTERARQWRKDNPDKVKRAKENYKRKKQGDGRE